MEKAILVGLCINPKSNINYYMKELANLANSCNIEVVDTITQNLERPTPNYYIGSGKIEEVKMVISAKDATMVIFDDELSPAQIRNLEKKLDVKVIDRSLLILDIFASRAKTKEAMLEVELAQLKYMLPRLVGLSSSLSRQGGTSGAFSSKGPGEKKIELDRRRIESQIAFLKEELKQIHQTKKTQKKQRLAQNIPIVALVGYTNAGKSATMNTLMQEFMHQEEKHVFEKDMLFATLQTHVRRIKLENNFEFLLVDTIGFVSKLPHHLVNSFKTTLEEVVDASLILHVIDVSDENYQEQIDVTNHVLQELSVTNIPKIHVLNKADLLRNEVYPNLDKSLFYSNKTKQNLQELLIMIKEQIMPKTRQVSLLIPYDQGAIINTLEEKYQIISKIYLDIGTAITANIPENKMYMFEKFLD